MIRTLLVLVTMLSATSAMAKTYKGQYDNREACVITIDKTAKGVMIGTGDADGFRSVLADKKINTTYFKYSSDGKAVRLAVTMYSNQVTAATFPNGKIRFCTARL